MKGLIRGLIIGLALALILVGTVFYLNQQRKKKIEQLSKEFTTEELIKMVRQQGELVCKQLVSELKSENACQQLMKTDDIDACYYCFALEKKDVSLCNKISEGTFWKEDCKKQLGKPELEMVEEGAIGELEKARKKARDLSREADMREIVLVQELYYGANGAYLTSISWPLRIGEFMTETPTDPGGGSYIWVNNIGSPQKFCAYAILEEGGWYTASHRGNFKCSDAVPTLNDCCF